MLAGLVSLAAVAGLLAVGAARSSLLVLLAATVGAGLVALPARRASVRRVVLVGGRRELERHLAARTGVDPDVVVGSCVTDGDASEPGVQPASLIPAAQGLAGLRGLVSRVRAEAVHVLPGAPGADEVVREVGWLLEDRTVSVGLVCPVPPTSVGRLRPVVSGGSTVLEVRARRGPGAGRVVKAVLDRVCAAVLLALSAPVLLLAWAAVRLDSPGPGFFVQTRVGLDGAPFRMLKLRSMRQDAESLLEALAEGNEADDVLFKIRLDPRVTRVGHWLRRSSIDELPQLLNVLRGEMSLVGPRPALPDEVAAYDATARRRLVVKPGLTGLWQVSGRSDLRWEESLQLDLYYVDNWRLRGDLGIAMRTVAAVCRGRGAY